jgi:hypothetical protein
VKAWRIAINGLLQSSDGPLKMKPFASLKRYRWQWQACGRGWTNRLRAVFVLKDRGYGIARGRDD